jgi:preprotein translocase subunit YajC
MTLIDLPIAFAQGEAPAAWVQFVPLGIMFLLFYLIWWMPMRKRQRAHQQMLDELKKGDRVVTNGGLYGEVRAIQGQVVQLKLGDSVHVRVSRSAISGMQGDETDGGGK